MESVNAAPVQVMTVLPETTYRLEKVSPLSPQASGEPSYQREISIPSLLPMAVSTRSSSANIEQPGQVGTARTRASLWTTWLAPHKVRVETARTQ